MYIKTLTLYTCSVADLLIINKNSNAANYNRALRGKEVKKAINACKNACRLHNLKYSKSIKVIVTIMMQHDQDDCEEHYRCVIDFCDLKNSRATIDISKADFKKYCFLHSSHRLFIAA